MYRPYSCPESPFGATIFRLAHLCVLIPASVLENGPEIAGVMKNKGQIAKGDKKSAQKFHSEAETAC